MGEKLEPYRKYGDKLLSLFIRLLSSRESYSLTTLAKWLGCSKATVLRLLNNIRMSYGVDLEEEFRGNRKYVSIRKPRGTLPALPLNHSEWQVLQMCRAFTEHLLGERLFDEATQALLKSRALMQEKDSVSLQHFACFRPGTIDYTAHHQMIHTLIESMENKKVCKVSYQSIGQSKAHTFYIKPLKLFSHHDTVYLHAQKAKAPGEKYRSPKYDPLLAVHRMKKVELTTIDFKPPDNYDFEKTFNKHFGVIKEEAFEVEVEFTGWSAHYVAERIWSPDQKMEKSARNKMKLIFTASSEPELISWMLSFGEEARLIRPKELLGHVADKVRTMNDMYS